MFTRKDMLTELKNTSEKDLFPIFIPSYNRSHDVRVWDKILYDFTPAALEKVFLVVRTEQYKSYKREYPKANYVLIPENTVTGVGSTRNFILEYCIEHRIPYAIDMDDDIKLLNYLFITHAQSGALTSHHPRMIEYQNHPIRKQQILQLACKISKEVFKADKRAILGNIRKQHFSQSPENSQIKYQINTAVTPRQIQIYNIKRVYKHSIRVPEEFNKHGDDIGVVAYILDKGFDCFNIPCLCYDYVDEKTNSVVRNPAKENRELHRLEYAGLQNYAIRDYLKWSFKFPDGEYMFGDVNWRNYHKLNDSERIRVFWR